MGGWVRGVLLTSLEWCLEAGDELVDQMVFPNNQMQRKTGGAANYGSTGTQAQSASSAAYEQNRPYNSSGNEYSKNSSWQSGNKNPHPQSYQPLPENSQAPPSMRNISPTRNDDRKSFPTFALKSLGSQALIQGSKAEIKEEYTSQSSTLLTEPVDPNIPDKASQLYRNHQDDPIYSPTRVRKPTNPGLQKPSQNLEIQSACLKSYSPIRSRGSNKSAKNQNVNAKSPQKYKPIPLYQNSQQQSLSLSDNIGKVNNNGAQKNAAVYHSVIMPGQKKQKSQNTFTNVFQGHKKMGTQEFPASSGFAYIISAQNTTPIVNQHPQKPFKYQNASSNGISINGFEGRFGQKSSPESPQTRFSNKKISDTPIPQTERPKTQNSSSNNHGPSFLKKSTEDKNTIKPKAQQLNKTEKSKSFATEQNPSKAGPKPNIDINSWKPAGLNLHNANSKLKKYESMNQNHNISSNSNSTLNLNLLQSSPVKLGTEKQANSNSSSNLFLNLESPVKLDTMKNLVSKKNSNVNSRKLDEEYPDKVGKDRQTLQETPRTSVEPKDPPAFKKKPDLLFQVKKLVDGDQEDEQIPARHIEIDDFEIVQKIGKGTYGDVFLAQDRQTKFLCVIKALSKKKIKEMQLQQHVFREIKIQFYLNHRHLTSLFGVFDDKNKIYLIMEFMPDGNMSSNGKKRIKENEAAYLLQQVCEGLLYMHREDIIHRDIKPQNLLMNNHYVKIGDFGTSVFGNQMRRTVVGCLAYISPQQLTNTPYDDKIDAWSTGILAYELLVGRPPFQEKIRHLTTKMYDGEPIENIKKRIEERADFPELTFPPELEISAQAKEFIQRLLQPDPFLRPELKWALKHKFIQKGREYQNYLDSQL